ncbi:MAG: TetR family transcriptional regulator [Rhodobacteraceae bacterium]|nr:TetR family transcriptional regulator [Paracoccaceae bacterium]
MTGRTRREKVDQREGDILIAARDVFVENGYDQARMAEVARRAGIAEGTVYLYFKSKNALLFAVLARFWDDLTAGARAGVEAETPGLPRLRCLMQYHMDCLSRDIELLQMAAHVQNLLYGDPETQDHLRRYVSVFDDVFRQCQALGQLSTDFPVWMARDLFFGTMEYSARTMRVRGVEQSAMVVAHLMMVFETSYRADAGEHPQSLNGVDRLDAVSDRLEEVVRQLLRSGQH